MEDILLARARAGDASAFRHLVESYSPVAWRTARILLADAGSAEDALQEAWIDVWRGLSRFEVGRPFRPWLLAIVANRCRMMGRRWVPTMLPLDAAEVEAIAAEGDLLLASLRREAGAELGAMLVRLPEGAQRVLQLRYFADLELTEIATVLGAPLGTVKSRLHRALAMLRAGVLAQDQAQDQAQGQGRDQVTRRVEGFR